jgi:carboxyl-terminal processing protease
MMYSSKLKKPWAFDSPNTLMPKKTKNDIAISQVFYYFAFCTLYLSVINRLAHRISSIASRYAFTGSVAVICFLLLTAFSPSTPLFEINKNLDILTTLYKELNTYYVDELNPTKLFETGMAEMCESLDPYTDYIPEESQAEYRQQTTGRYGGIGALIGSRGEYVIITDPYEGFPAAKSGLRAGDRIVSIDNKVARSLNSDDVSKMLKGKAGTSVKVKISRLEADGKEREFEQTLTREEIKIKNVPYSGLVNNDIGYIRLGSFTEKASNEVRLAYNTLIAKNKVKGVILDLRGNPGGLLNEAINVANVFVERNLEIVSTKGKIEDQNKQYFTLNEAVDTHLPLVVLVDGGSASAAEIVSGSLQDLDRAVVIGQRTYGKGLVQSTHSLPFNTKVKITTAKYYIPSGRCIQAINYADRGEDGSVKRKADSLKVAYKTKGGRVVYDGVGIDPDIKIEPEKLSQIAMALFGKNMFFDYATEYRAKHELIAPAKSFQLTDKEYEEFVSYVTAKDISYSTQTEKLIDALKDATDREKIYDGIKDDYEALKKKISHDKKQDLYKEKKQVRSILEEEIASRYTLNAGRTESTFRHDDEITKAVELLSDETKHAAILKKK